MGACLPLEYDNLGSREEAAAGGNSQCFAAAALTLVHRASLCRMHPLSRSRLSRQVLEHSFSSAKYHCCASCLQTLQPTCFHGLSPYKPHKSMIAGLEAGQRQSAALAACVAVQAHKAELRRSSHITELTAGIANLVIGLQVLCLKQIASAPTFCTKLPHHWTCWDSHGTSCCVNSCYRHTI